MFASCFSEEGSNSRLGSLAQPSLCSLQVLKDNRLSIRPDNAPGAETHPFKNIVATHW